jgi:hypothetical protein
MCHLLSRIEPDLLTEGTSHTTDSLRKAVTTSRSNLQVAHTTMEFATVEEDGSPP